MKRIIDAMYSDISNILDTPGAFHRCRVCGFELDHKPGDGGYYTRYGWPKHCGKTMIFVQPALGAPPPVAPPPDAPLARYAAEMFGENE